MSLKQTVLALSGSLLLVLLTAPVSHAAKASDKVSFNNQIEPILSEHCYKCHGPDSSTRKPKKQPLRLDRELFAFQVRDNGQPVIVKGNPKASEVIRRIRATDDDVMPPASEHKQLKPEEIVLIEKWVAQGGQYEKHWSLIPPTRAPMPDAGKRWAKNPIDNLVAQKLSENGLKPNPEEGKARLYRRLCFDLTGLPPSPDDLRAFLADKSPKAYENAVERLLATDAYAEQFTRRWLDAVRYADTQGIHHDHVRSIWPYRDWVLNAFRTNMPFDKFTIEQIAGDMLPNATMGQKIASGYNRLLPTTGEGGAIPDEYAAIYAKDRVDTTTAVWLGFTTGCATCHDHKFDPIKMKDFYAMTAFFRNSTQPALDGGANANTPPLLFVPADQDRDRWPSLQDAIASAKEAIKERKKSAKPEFDLWLAEMAAKPSDDPLEIKPALWLPLTETNGPWHGNAGERSLQWSEGKEQRPGPFGPAPLISGGAAVDNAEPTFTRSGKATYGALLYLEEKPSGAVFSRMNKSDEFRGWDLFLTEGRPTVHIIDQWPDASLKVTAKETLKPGEWHHVMAVFDGGRKGAEAIALYIDGRKADVEVNNNKLGSNIVANVAFRLGARSENEAPGEALSNGKVFLQDLRFYNEALTALQVARLAGNTLVRDFVSIAVDQRNEDQTNRLFNLFLAGFDQGSQKLQTDLAQLKSEEEDIKMRGATTLIMEEKKDSEPEAFMLVRGNYASKGEKVSAATPEALPPMASDLPRNRLGLARWFVSRDNPLTARVTVNRLWADLFGLGIVETTEDLGVKGARPTNQALLDWLAVEFVDSSWNVRQIVKLMVTSATYRQSEVISPQKLEKDPQNKLYARGPHLRLDAEEIRDQALAASGLLVKKVGGPPVKPYQPEGVWEAVAMKDSNTRFYKQDAGDALYRRSLYTFWKRVAPPPSLEILNAPTREVFCTRRDRTDTPLQAFVTLNDPQFMEAARHLAARALKSAKDFDPRLDQITESLLARDLTSKERPVLRKLHDRALKVYENDSKAAESLIAVGESKPDVTLPAPELAAWTLVASEVMNLDECLTK